jgi:hypothetical protein
MSGMRRTPASPPNSVHSMNRRAGKVTRGFPLHSKGETRSVAAEREAVVDEVVLWLIETYAVEELAVGSDDSGRRVLEVTLRVPEAGIDPSSN